MASASMVPVAALAALEQAINGYLALDPASRGRLAGLAGRVIAIELRGTPLTLHLRGTDAGIQLMGDYDGEVDTTLSGAPFSLLRMGLGDAREALFKGDVEIRGNVELGQEFKRILDGIDIDWEEHLSHLAGDVVAHQVGTLFRDLKAFIRRGAEVIGRDASDYLRFEKEMLPLKEEVEEFLSGIDTLRSDVDRLEARIKRLVNQRVTDE